MEFVDSAGKYILDADFFQQSYGLNRCPEILAYGNDYQVDIFQGQGYQRSFVGRIEDVGLRDVVFDGFNVLGMDVRTDYLVAHVGKVASKVCTVNSESDD